MKECAESQAILVGMNSSVPGCFPGRERDRRSERQFKPPAKQVIAWVFVWMAGVIISFHVAPFGQLMAPIRLQCVFKATIIPMALGLFPPKPVIKPQPVELDHFGESPLVAVHRVQGFRPRSEQHTSALQSLMR